MNVLAGCRVDLTPPTRRERLMRAGGMIAACLFSAFVWTLLLVWIAQLLLHR